ncbi:AAA-like domain-containing protein [Lyngbya sp. PCC 8106]|uniref:AAA-like domain-containing protein n=1 Tax=Lyngbya sp. (strain PCC 8106) TaxID=313612 RepID=UPI0000EA97D4|nr:AAA-like domain-containing protein [Lyngbya sp. PCC 8106]EAW36807.1 hypothetical protein L8106_26637 [Lyngbya sp. PCC 8106]
MSNSSRKKKTILFLAANPKQTNHLRLDQEVKEIQKGLERAKKRSQFNLESRFAVTAREMQRAVLELQPQFVHFSGHGAGENGLVLEDETGQVKFVSAKGLTDLFQLFKTDIECVVLNACYSEIQAKAIAYHIPYVIGMKQQVGDQAAQEFAIGFYDALGNGRDIEFAYKYGCTSISMAGIPEELTPVIRTKPDESNAEDIEEIEEDSKPENTVIENPRSSETSTLLLTELENPEGSVSLNSPFYIERPPIESDCYETILKPGALIRIKAPRQMGKTSLMQRILAHSKQNEYHTAYLNFQSADSDFFSNIDDFLRWFCGMITEELELEDRLENLWKGSLGSKAKCTNYFRRYLLKTINEPLTLGLDEVDQVFQHLEIAQEFFSLLRVWHENGKNQPDWKKLRLVIAHSKEVYIPLNINQSPFNVGLPIDLPELTFEQISELVKRHGLNWSVREVNSLMEMVDGHPYLVRKALYEMTRHQLSFAEFIETAPTQSGIYNDHLRRHLLNLQDNEKLAEAMKKVVFKNEPVRLEESQAFQLRSMGLIKRVGNDVVPLCNLYRLYFSDRFGE